MSAVEEFLEACTRGEVSKMQALLREDGGLVNSANDQCESALHLACSTGQTLAVRLLLSFPQLQVDTYCVTSGRPVNYCWNDTCPRALARAVLEDPRTHLDHVAARAKKLTPMLWLASLLGRPDTVKLLLASGYYRRLDPSWLQRVLDLKFSEEDQIHTRMREIQHMLREHSKRPIQTVRQLRRELQWPRVMALVMAQCILLQDRFLVLAGKQLA